MDDFVLRNGAGTTTGQTITVTLTTDVHVGADLNIGAGQAAGTYSGVYTITTNSL